MPKSQKNRMEKHLQNEIKSILYPIEVVFSYAIIMYVCPSEYWNKKLNI